MRIPHPTKAHAFTAWGLLSLWLFLGGVALADQLYPAMEVSTQDEDALAAFAFALKADYSDSDVRHARTLSVTPCLVDALAGCRIRTQGRPPQFFLLRPLSARSLVQRLSVYRI